MIVANLFVPIVLLLVLIEWAISLIRKYATWI